MNLTLLDAPAPVPGDNQKELALTLMEILINAACEHEFLPRAQGEEDERAEAHD
jgi:hypothetical protein